MSRLRTHGTILAILAIAIAITLFSPWASSSPDGLEKVAEQHEFLDRAAEPGFRIIPDYQFPGVSDERVATILAGVTGVLVVTAVTVGGGLLLSRRARRNEGPNAGSGR